MTDSLLPPGLPVDRLLDLISRAIREDTFVRCVISGVDPLPGEEPVNRIVIRWITAGSGFVFSLSCHHPRRDETRNLASDDFLLWLRTLLQTRCSNLLLCTTSRDWQWVRVNAGHARLISHPPSHRQIPSRSHDRVKASLLGDLAIPWLKALGVFNLDGRLRSSMAAKHRQIHRYIEILDHHLGGLIRQQPTLRTLDAGSGKGYLTFAVWHWLRQARGTLPFTVLGLEVRNDLVEECTRVASAVGATELSFRRGTIGDDSPEPVEVILALHACNTATDDAILLGLRKRARAIVVAPCCHQELRPMLSDPPMLARTLSQGILKERWAEWVTDSLRMLYLEAAGYQTTVMEFVDAGHTPKNLLIVAIEGNRPEQRSQAAAEIREIRAFLGISSHRLDGITR